MRIDTHGNVGIGTDSPTRIVELVVPTPDTSFKSQVQFWDRGQTLLRMQCLVISTRKLSERLGGTTGQHWENLAKQHFISAIE